MKPTLHRLRTLDAIQPARRRMPGADQRVVHHAERDDDYLRWLLLPVELLMNSIEFLKCLHGGEVVDFELADFFEDRVFCRFEK